MRPADAYRRAQRAFVTLTAAIGTAHSAGPGFVTLVDDLLRAKRDAARRFYHFRSRRFPRSGRVCR